MKSLAHCIALFLSITLLLSAGCTHNNGDIGPFFGKWKMTKMTIDGEENKDYEGNIFWSYQSTTISMLRVVDDMSSVLTFGNWETNDDYRILNISFPDEIFPPLVETKLPREATLQIIKIKGSEMILQYITHESEIITYYFTKW